MNFPGHKGRSRLYWIAFAFLVGGLLTQLVRWWYISRTTDNWQSVAQRKANAVISSVQNSFIDYQRETYRVAQHLASLQEIRNTVSNGGPQKELFTLLERVRMFSDMSVEIYDRNHALLAWQGSTAGLQHGIVDIARETTFVSAGPVYSYLTIITPVLADGQYRGSVVVHRLFDVNYPISNRFISSAAFTQTFPHRLGYPVTFRFSGNRDIQKKSDAIAIPLIGVQGNLVGYAIVEGFTLQTTLDQLREVFDNISRVFFVVVTVLILIIALQSVHKARSVSVRIAMVSVLIWLFRYTLLWLQFPSGMMGGGIFDPRLFASPFGYGIAKSIGELLITSLAGLANVVYIAWLLLPTLLNAGRVRVGQGIRTAGAITLLVFLSALLFILHRGFTAFVRSAVFDSTLRYSDPTSILPPFEMVVMLLNLFLVAIAFVVAAVLLTFVGYRLVSRWSVDHVLCVSMTGGILVVFAFLFGIVHPSPLASLATRLLVVALAVAGAVVLARNGVRSSTAALVVLSALVVIVVQLDDQVHQRERRNIELLAAELSRPADTWITHVLERTLADMQNSKHLDVFESGNADQLYSLAFTLWSESFLSRLGYDCGVYAYDPEGHLVSFFRIGIRPEEVRLVLSSFTPPSLSSSGGQVHIREEESVLGRRKIYAGSANLVGVDGSTVGSVEVGIATSGHLLFRTVMPPFLQTFEREEAERYLRGLLISEFVGDTLMYTTGEDVAFPSRLSDEIKHQVQKVDGVWVTENIDGNLYETFYKRVDSPNETVLALGWKKEDWRWHFFDFMRYVLSFLLVSLLMAGIAFGILVVRGYSPVPLSFRAKLFLAFFVVSTIPLVLLAYYNRDIAIERAHQLIIERLTQESAFVRDKLMLRLQSDVLPTRTTQKLNDEWCEMMSEEIGTDFSIYVNAEKSASSQPELYQAGILNARLSPAAYFNIILQRKNFFAERRTIGSYDYLMGYRPVMVNADGQQHAILAVPLLYSSIEIEEDLTRRNTLLFSAYAVILILIVVVGTLFADRIAAPIRQLIAATRRIAQGELDLRLPAVRRDEIGDLYRAFNSMTEDLQRHRESLIKAEREMAWREMAKQVAHEIKNPLTPVRLSIQHLQQAFRDKDKDFPRLLEQVTKMAINQIDALSHIASQFAHFARMPERKEEDLDLREIISEVVKLFDEYKDVKMRYVRSSETMTVRADREELRRAFINIVRNAVQAMNEEGEITIEIQETDGFYQVAFSDSGPGIPPEILPRLFEPNFSTKSEGMGLGLAIVKKTIDDLHGRIEVSSRQAKGTTVKITLPKK